MARPKSDEPLLICHKQVNLTKEEGKEVDRLAHEASIEANDRISSSALMRECIIKYLLSPKAKKR
jgi:hypothetical protein